MPWMFSSSLYPFHLLWLVASPCYFWLLIPTIGLLPHATSGSLWSLISRQAVITSFRHPGLPIVSVKSWKDDQVDVRLRHCGGGGGRVDSFTHCTYTSYTFLSQSITVVSCCCPGRLASCNCPSAFARRGVPLYRLRRAEKNI